MEKPLMDVDMNTENAENSPGKLIIESDRHTLIVVEEPETFLPIELDPKLDLDVESLNDLDLYVRIPQKAKYKLFLGDFDDSNNHNFNKIISVLQESNNGTLELHIASRGGNLDEGKRLTNLLENKFENVVSYLDYGFSMGALIFLAANQRIVYEHSEWMIHSYSGGAWGKRNDMIKRVEFGDKTALKYYSEYLKDFFTKKEIKKINRGDDFWLDSEKMLERGIATHIMIKGEALTREEYENYKKKNK